MVVGGETIKPASILIDKVEALGKKVSPDLEEASHKLVRASTTLDKAVRLLIEQHPDLAVLANRLPIVKGQHPYLRIRQAAYLNKYLH